MPAVGARTRGAGRPALATPAHHDHAAGPRRAGVAAGGGVPEGPVLGMPSVGAGGGHLLAERTRVPGEGMRLQSQGRGSEAAGQALGCDCALLDRCEGRRAGLPAAHIPSRIRAPPSSLCVQVRPSQPSRQRQEKESPLPTHVPPFTQGLGRQLLFWAVRGTEEEGACSWGAGQAVDPHRVPTLQRHGPAAGPARLGEQTALGRGRQSPSPMLQVLPFQPGRQAQRKVSPWS